MIHSLSSQFFTTITIARNPQGKEENWLNGEEQTRPSSRVKLAANIAYSLTAIVALVETAVSGAFVAIAFSLRLVSSRPYEKATEWLESSAFSIIWSIGGIAFRNAPNLPTREESARNLLFRGFINAEPNIVPQAPLSSRLFMIVRELPPYLSKAYSLRYKDVKPEEGMFASMKGKISRYKQLIQEVLYMRGSQAIFKRNIQRLDTDFDQLNSELDKTKRAICAYFVSSEDSNGAILGDHLYYYHHYKIDKFRKHFDVSAKVVRSTKEMFEHLNNLKATYPDRPIKVVDIVAHGSPESIVINHHSSEETVETFEKQHVGDGEFGACAADAAIILDACSTGAGSNSIAQVIAEKNPGKKVFAPGAPLFFSKPVFKKQGDSTIVDHVTHGFAVVNAYTSREFQTVGNV